MKSHLIPAERQAAATRALNLLGHLERLHPEWLTAQLWQALAEEGHVLRAILPATPERPTLSDRFLSSQVGPAGSVERRELRAFQEWAVRLPGSKPFSWDRLPADMALTYYRETLNGHPARQTAFLATLALHSLFPGLQAPETPPPTPAPNAPRAVFPMAAEVPPSGRSR